MYAFTLELGSKRYGSNFGPLEKRIKLKNIAPGDGSLVVVLGPGWRRKNEIETHYNLKRTSRALMVPLLYKLPVKFTCTLAVLSLLKQCMSSIFFLWISVLWLYRIRHLGCYILWRDHSEPVCTTTNQMKAIMQLSFNLRTFCITIFYYDIIHTFFFL